jgi:DNA repair protein RecN (Recombination protein N)
MIERLSIRNLILIKEASLFFGPDLNILTGETGSGKSAVLSALRLVLGDRADVQLVGKHGELAIVEADVVLSHTKSHIRREIHRSGKSRCFVNDELISLGELRALFSDTIELADQGAAYKLSEPDELRKLLDLFGKIDSARYATVFAICQEKRVALADLQKIGEEIRLEENRLREQLAFLDKVDWQKDEEEELAATHLSLSLAQKSAEKLAEIGNYLSDGPHPILPMLKRFAGQVESLQLPEVSTMLQAARANLEEVNLFLASYFASLDFTSQRLETVEQRISEIESVKRRFARTQEEASNIRERLRARLSRLEQIDEDISGAQISLVKSEAELALFERELTMMRLSSAKTMADAVLSELHALNIPDAKLEIQIHPKQSSPTGADEIRWLFSANLGQPLLPLDDVASGGELSRLLLAIKIALKEKKCLILDEIDGNVGGQTAAILGLKLQELGTYCQIICVTHFVQVAKYAMHHFLVSKQTINAEAITVLKKLDESSRIMEYSRMTGAIPK